MINIKDVSVSINNNLILNNINISTSNNKILMIVGPNGCGKSTLVKAVMNTIKYDGLITINNDNIKNLKQIEIAKKIAVLTQKNESAFSHKVIDVVSIGRYAYKDKWNNNIKDTDKKIIDYALEITNTTHLKNRVVSTLSGGELQLINLAKVFAQDPKLLILDEPTNHLDINHKIQIYETIKKWAQEKEDRQVIAIEHDIYLIKKYATDVVVINKGEVFIKGLTKEVITKQNMTSVYGNIVADYFN